MPFDLIVAQDLKNGIGKNGTLPWRLPADLKHFKEITTFTRDPLKRNIVMMGRKTWESLPAAFRPLPKRLNVVLTRNGEYDVPEGVLVERELERALKLKDKLPGIENIFVIGGAKIFQEAVRLPDCQRIFMTRIMQDFNCDTFFPPLDPTWREVQTASSSENEIPFSFSELSR